MLTSTFALLLIGMSVSATVITVSNNPNSPGQYASLQEAIDAANPADTLYVSGSNSDYGVINITKKLTLVGAGYHPNTQFGYGTYIGSLSFNIEFDGESNPVSNPSESVIMGFIFGYLTVDGNEINDITIERNWIAYFQFTTHSSKNYNNWIIRNNIIGQLLEDRWDGAIRTSNFIIANNILLNGFSNFNSNSLILINNLLAQDFGFYQISYAIICNNIFYEVSTGGESYQCNYCTFNNNISFGGG